MFFADNNIWKCNYTCSVKVLIFLANMLNSVAIIHNNQLQPVMGFRGFTWVRANLFLEWRDNQ